MLAASITRDPLVVSSVPAAFYTSWLLVGLPAGALVGRWPRRLVMITADLIRAGILTGLAGLVGTGRAALAPLVTAILVVFIAQCFFDAASQSVIPVIVGRDKETVQVGPQPL